MTPDAASSYRNALEFWYGLVNYEQRAPQPADLKLDRMRTLLARLGDPHRRLRVVHVAGSKGKGSTSAMLAEILRQAGYRIGLFTSPHLCRVEERIQVDSQEITSEELAALLEEVRLAVVSGPAALRATFFEVATAVGFLHFVRRRVDLAVLEVGLGGRFDSTNVCRPEVAMITSISLDHTQQLGDRLASIAFEKAGIIKRDRPTISGATAPEAAAVIQTICQERRSPLRQLGVDFAYRHEPGRIEKGDSMDVGDSPPDASRPARHSLARVEVTTRQRTWPLLELGLLGGHQAANAALAIACVEQLRAAGWHIPDTAVASGLAKVNWPARMEVVGHRPLIVLDCAHNVASAEALVQTLEESFPRGRRLLVFAVSNDKDVAGMLRVLAPHFARLFLTRYSGSARSVAPEELARLLSSDAQCSSSIHPTAPQALRAAQAAAQPEALICVAGSVFLAGELRLLLFGDQRAFP
jgi:dihydrofolate synthase/folylpolyglutamate synthase